MSLIAEEFENFPLARVSVEQRRPSRGRRVYRYIYHALLLSARAAMPSGILLSAAALSTTVTQSPTTRFSFGNSTFDISALSRPGAFYGVQVRAVSSFGMAALESFGS